MSVPAWRAVWIWLGRSPERLNHQVEASSTNWTCVRSNGRKTAAIDRCQRSVVCQSRKPGLAPGSRGVRPPLALRVPPLSPGSPR